MPEENEGGRLEERLGKVLAGFRKENDESVLALAAELGIPVGDLRLGGAVKSNRAAATLLASVVSRLLDEGVGLLVGLAVVLELYRRARESMN